MSRRAIIYLKVLAHAACLLPLTFLAWRMYRSATIDPSALGPDPTATVTFFTGFGALRLLVFSLAVTPVRKLLPKLAWLVRFRRLLGLYAFFYASLHLVTYLWLYAGWSWPAMKEDLLQRPYIWAGVAAWGLMVPLALTSTAFAIRRMGGRRWGVLHKLVYVSAIAGVAHYWWIVKRGVWAPLTITLVLAALLAARPILAWWTRPAKRPLRPAVPLT